MLNILLSKEKPQEDIARTQGFALETAVRAGHRGHHHHRNHHHNRHWYNHRRHDRYYW